MCPGAFRLKAISPADCASISSSGYLPDPGPAYKPVLSGDFNGDGKSDILWRNLDGSVGTD